MRITKHAEERIQERGVTREQLVECLTNGKIYEHKTDSSKCICIHTGINLYIVMDSGKTKIITVFRKEY